MSFFTQFVNAWMHYPGHAHHILPTPALKSSCHSALCLSHGKDLLCPQKCLRQATSFLKSSHSVGVNPASLINFQVNFEIQKIKQRLRLRFYEVLIYQQTNPQLSEDGDHKAGSTFICALQRAETNWFSGEGPLPPIEWPLIFPVASKPTETSNALFNWNIRELLYWSHTMLMLKITVISLSLHSVEGQTFCPSCPVWGTREHG